MKSIGLWAQEHWKESEDNTSDANPGWAGEAAQEDRLCCWGGGPGGPPLLLEPSRG